MWGRSAYLRLKPLLREIKDDPGKRRGITGDETEHSTLFRFSPSCHFVAHDQTPSKLLPEFL
jgi:hypothetical protein